MSLFLFISVLFMYLFPDKKNGKKRTNGMSPGNISELEETRPIYLTTKATNIPRGPTTDISKMSPRFSFQMDFVFSNVKSICGFTSTFVAICSATSHSFVFPSRSKRPPLDIIKFLVTALRNQDKKVSSIRVDED